MGDAVDLADGQFTLDTLEAPCQGQQQGRTAGALLAGDDAELAAGLEDFAVNVRVPRPAAELLPFGLGGALRVICLPLLSALAALASLGWLGQPLTLFSLFGLLLITAIAFVAGMHGFGWKDRLIGVIGLGRIGGVDPGLGTARLGSTCGF